jgi:hypothetical protein
MAEKRLLRAAVLGFSLPLCVAAVACSGDFRKPFQRWSPTVDTAIGELDAGKIDAATGRLGSYLSATACDGGTVVVPGAADAAPATFDLGLALFSIAESFGKPFGTYVPPRPADAGDAPEDPTKAERKAQVDCARSLLDQALAGTLPADLEARARYLRGNLAYLDGRWDDAVADYDRALAIVPGLLGDAGDGIGRDAAWNRALALRNKEEEDKEKDAGADAEPDAQPDAEPDAGNDAGDDAGPDSGDDAGKDAGDDAGDDAGKDAGDDAGKDGGEDGGDAGKDGGEDGGDAGKDGGDDAGKDGGKDGKDGKDGGDDAGKQDGGGGEPQPSPASTASQDERMLDQFEGAPTFQKEEAKLRQGRRVQGMPDK